jgi:hypothetical protein
MQKNRRNIMVKNKLTGLQQLSIDLYHGKVESYSKKEAEDKLREKIEEAVGGEWNFFNFMQNEWKVYAILSETLTIITTTLMKETFGDFVEYKDTALGDILEFEVDDGELYEVAIVADGQHNFQRQKLMGRKVPMTSFTLGLKIYAEWDQFMTGRIDYAKAINLVTLSFENQIAQKIGTAFTEAYSDVGAHFTVTGTMEEDKLTELLAKVEGSTLGGVKIYGSKYALSKIPNIESLQINATEKRNRGYVQVYNGVDCVEIKNTYNGEDDLWGFDNNRLIIVPSGVKPIMFGFEGEAFAYRDDSASTRLDKQVEHTYSRKAQLAVIKTKNNGAYNIVA